MATTQKHSSAAAVSNFSDALFQVAHRFSVYTAFDDFLTMAIAAVTQNTLQQVSYYEAEYLAVMEKYKSLEVRHEFPKAFASLIMEMEERVSSEQGNDVLGEFFELNISNGKNGQFFTPYHVCMMMASLSSGEEKETPETKSLRILDPTCGSGRMLLASSRINGPGHEYYGVDIDPTCIKMAALNLFLNGVWNAELLCANTLLPQDFRVAYRTSLFPLGIFKIEQKEKSKLWHLLNPLFTEKETTTPKHDLQETTFTGRARQDGTQLDLFSF